MDSISYYKSEIDKYIDKLLPKNKSSILTNALRYTACKGGKRLRPILCIASFKTCKGSGKKILPIACAIELVHTYSLVHDDLPCMDNDNIRRGKPTCHNKFGEDAALLTGNLLLTTAFEWIINTPKISNGKKIQILSCLLQSIGSKGIIGGQIMDLRKTVSATSVKVITDIYRKKTASLIRASVEIGAITAGTNKKKNENLINFGNKMGMVFQIIDDFFDMEKDKKNSLNLPAKIGREKAYKKADTLLNEARKSLKIFHNNVLLLNDILDWMKRRLDSSKKTGSL